MVTAFQVLASEKMAKHEDEFRESAARIQAAKGSHRRKIRRDDVAPGHEAAGRQDDGGIKECRSDDPGDHASGDRPDAHTAHAFVDQVQHALKAIQQHGAGCEDPGGTLQPGTAVDGRKPGLQVLGVAADEARHDQADHDGQEGVGDYPLQEDGDAQAREVDAANGARPDDPNRQIIAGHRLAQEAIQSAEPRLRRPEQGAEPCEGGALEGGNGHHEQGEEPADDEGRTGPQHLEGVAKFAAGTRHACGQLGIANADRRHQHPAGEQSQQCAAGPGQPQPVSEQHDPARADDAAERQGKKTAATYGPRNGSWHRIQHAEGVRRGSFVSERLVVILGYFAPLQDFGPEHLIDADMRQISLISQASLT